MKVYGSINTESGSEISTTPATPSIVSNALTIDCSKANIFVISHNANINTLTVSNQNDGQTIAIILNEVGSGNTVTWPGNFTFIGSNTIDSVNGQINQVWATYSATLSVWIATIESNNGGAGTGTVTSVALADGSTTPIYSITGSPITSSGTLTLTLSTESANVVFAGPASGSAAQPTFRSLALADMPPPSLEKQTAANYTILSTTTSTFTISGNQSALFVSGYVFAVFGSSSGSNDAIWTTASSVFNSGPNQTVITITATGTVVTGLAVNGVIAQIVFNTSTVGTIADTSTNTYIEVFVNGIYQEQGSTKAYQVTGGNQVTFNYGLSLNSDVVFIGFT